MMERLFSCFFFFFLFCCCWKPVDQPHDNGMKSCVRFFLGKQFPSFVLRSFISFSNHFGKKRRLNRDFRRNVVNKEKLFAKVADSPIHFNLDKEIVKLDHCREKLTHFIVRAEASMQDGRKNQNIYVFPVKNHLFMYTLQGEFFFYLEATVSINMFALHLAYPDCRKNTRTVRTITIKCYCTKQMCTGSWIERAMNTINKGWMCWTCVCVSSFVYFNV